MTANKQPVFINGGASLSALGSSDELTKASFVVANKRLPNSDLLYQGVKDLELNEGSQRIYFQLSQVIESLLEQLAMSAGQLANTVLFIGSSSLDIGAAEIDQSKTFWLSQLDEINQRLIEKYRFSSLNFTFNTACTASANALIYATKLIEQGEIEQAAVIGCEFYNRLTIKGFSSLELVSERGQFSLSQLRDGLVLGEGVGALFLSSEVTEHTQLQVLGGYSSCDTDSLTATREDGSHIRRVIEKSLTIAGVTADQVDLIKVHATASQANDQAEVAAIKALFNELPPVLALKPYIGHTLGACGVLEIALLVDLIKQDFMPVPDYAIIEQAQNLLPFVKSGRRFNRGEIILANHFGFGGNNAVLVLKNVSGGGRHEQSNRAC